MHTGTIPPCWDQGRDSVSYFCHKSKMADSTNHRRGLYSGGMGSHGAGLRVYDEGREREQWRWKNREERESRTREGNFIA